MKSHIDQLSNKDYSSRFGKDKAVDGVILFIPIEGVKELRMLVGKKMRAYGASVVATHARTFNLDNLRSLIREILRAEGTGAVLFNSEYTNAAEGKLHDYTGFRSTNCFAMIRRCNSLVPSPMHSKGASR